MKTKYTAKIPTHRLLRQGDEKFNFILSCMKISRLTWDIQDPVPNKTEIRQVHLVINSTCARP